MVHTPTGYYPVLTDQCPKMNEYGRLKTNLTYFKNIHYRSTPNPVSKYMLECNIEISIKQKSPNFRLQIQVKFGKIIEASKQFSF